MDFPCHLQQTLDRLRALTRLDIRSGWRIAPEPVPTVPDERWQRWPLAQLNPRGHIAWPQGRQELWLYQQLSWPEQLQGYPIHAFEAKLALRWWADLAEIFVDGEQVQSGDLFDCFGRIPLTAAVQPGTTVAVALRLLSPSHDPGALVRSQVMLERPQATLPEPGFIADELAVVATYEPFLAPEHRPDWEALLAKIDWQHLCDRGVFDLSLDTVRRWLLPLTDELKRRQIICLGHAHLDMAWLWPVADTWEAAERTFQSVLQLQKDFPELTYTHSTPALFAWLQQHRPQLLATIQEQVAQGRWSIDAGLWVEPELNLIGGEAIARQILYGQCYCQATFGSPSPIAWLPDSFGFCWQLPQLLRQGQIHCFATQKLRWNDTNPFPYELFRWRGRDGSEMLALTLPPIGSDIDPLAMARYAFDWEARTQRQQCLWLPGVGDHGGGPSRDMLEQARRWQKSPFFPSLRFGQVRELAPELATPELSEELPLWEDELYLELHRGCYTTHADQKWYNRRCEERLFEAEGLSVIAERVADHPYPQEALETAWKQTLFNQFHDILPGSATPEVFEDANRDWRAALQTSYDVARAAVGAIAPHIHLDPPEPGAQPFLLWNPLNWPRRELVAIPVATDGGQILDAEGAVLPVQRIDSTPDPTPTAYPPGGNNTPHLLVEAAVPPLGYSVLWLVPAPTDRVPAPTPETWVLENPYLQVTVNPATGDLISLYDKQRRRQLLNGPSNQLQAFADSGQYWDAWNIAPDYLHHPLPPFQLERINWVETGPLRQRLRVIRWLGQSRFQQDYVLCAQAEQLRIESTVDWRETQVLVKANFALALAADQATCEIPFGAIDHPTRPRTPQEKAKWEVPALRWADLSQPGSGVSILTDAKHGFDLGPDRLRLTLLKAPLWPNPGADRGQHRITYSIYPHGGDWRQAGTVRRAIALNQPLRVWPLEVLPGGTLPPCHSFWKGGQCGILAALKKAESGQGYVARCYEPHGQSVNFDWAGICDLSPQHGLDLLETPTGSVSPQLSPWCIQTIGLGDRSD